MPASAAANSVETGNSPVLGSGRSAFVRRLAVGSRARGIACGRLDSGGLARLDRRLDWIAECAALGNFGVLRTVSGIAGESCTRLDSLDSTRCPCGVYAVCMLCVCCVYAMYMLCTGCVLGMCMLCVCYVYGMGTQCACHVHAMCMLCACCVHAMCMLGLCYGHAM